MPKIQEEAFKQKRAQLSKLNEDFNQWRPHFQEVAKYILPRRYDWLVQRNASLDTTTKAPSLNTNILDPTGTSAARTLAHGLMNGITSPARAWFRLRLSEFAEDINGYPLEYLMWLEEAHRRMEIILSESNYYNAQGIQYLELSVFGTSSMILYDDFEDIIRCYNSPMGEYRLYQDNRRVVVGFAREFQMTVDQVVKEFGLENVSDQTKTMYTAGGAGKLQTVAVSHFIEPNNLDDPARISSTFDFREFYWESANHTDGHMLRIKGFREKPIIAPRWELIGNETYGTSPSFDALPDIKQLQLESKQKAQGMDKMIRPPIVADVTLRGQPTALLPGGVSYVSGNNSFGAKPIYTVNPPVGEMSKDIADIQIRIREMFYNNLFRNVSQLETVRSAAEVYERKAEDMVLLGGILERFHNEALDPVIKRTFNIMLRKGLFPPPPPGLDVSTIDIQYTSILADAQRAANTGSIERFMQVIGQLAAAVPEVLRIPDYDELVRDYARRLNVPAKNLKSREQVTAELEAEKEQLEAQQAALVGNELSTAAKNLSDTDVGGGRNAVQELLNG